MNDLYSHSTQSFASVLARIVFVGYCSFLLFWVGGPFTEKISDVNDITTSNMVNQIVIVTLFLAACISLIPIRCELVTLLKKEKFLLIFLLWCLLSIIWSDFKLVSIKRYFQVLTSVTICCAFLLHTISDKDILKYFKPLLFVYISLTVLAIIFMPSAIDPNFNSWRGLTSHKNQLGQASLVSVLIWFYAFRHEMGKDKIVALVMSFSSFILLLGSRSTTPIVTLGILALLGIILAIDARTKTLGVGRFFSVLTLLTIIGISILIIKTDPALITSLPALVGKNSTFSGRADIWSYIYDEAKRHFFFGCGYGSFWAVGNSEVLTLYNSLHIIIFQAHMGYLDLLNEVGIIGLFLFFLMVVSYFIKSTNTQGNQLGLWFIVVVLIINLQETTLFRPNSLTGLMFILFYLAPQVESMFKRQHIPIQR
jgi:O-antigen ligase